MAKTPKLQKRDVSVRSRAARRGEEPPSKDLASVKLPVEESDYKPWLHSAQSAGIQKKQKKKQLTRAQKVRQQKGAEKADENASRLEKKIADSKRRAGKVQARRKDWEDLNDEAEKETVKEIGEKAGFTVLGAGEQYNSGESGDEEGDRDGDEDMGAGMAEPEPESEANRSPAQVLSTNPPWASMHTTTGDFLGGEVT